MHVMARPREEGEYLIVPLEAAVRSIGYHENLIDKDVATRRGTLGCPLISDAAPTLSLRRRLVNSDFLSMTLTNPSFH
jgi:hypothetical protein